MSDGADTYVLGRSIAHLLHRAQKVASDRFARQGHEISLRQFQVLTAIKETPGATQNDLVKAACIDRSTLADMLASLCAMALIEKTRSAEDGRARVVTLTEAGCEALARADADARKADKAVLEAIGRRRTSVEEGLARLARKVDEAAALQEKKAAKDRKRQRDEAKRKARCK